MTAVEKYVASLVVFVSLTAVSACAGTGDQGSDPDAGRETTGVPSPDNSPSPTKSSQTSSTGHTDEPTSDTAETDGSDTAEDAGPGFIQKVLSIVPNTRLCTDTNTLELGTPSQLDVDRLQKRVICFADRGWKSPSALPGIQLTLPDGSHTRVIASGGDHGVWLWQMSPGVGTGPVDRTGSYHFTISAPLGTHGPPPSSLAPTGSSTSSPTGSSSTASTTGPAYFGTITVVRSGVPRLVSSSSAPPGGVVEVTLAGYAPGSTVQVVAYGPGEPDSSETMSYPRLEALPGAVVGAEGEARISWTVPGTTTPGRYGLWVDPLPFGCRQLCLGVDVS